MRRRISAADGGLAAARLADQARASRRAGCRSSTPSTRPGPRRPSRLQDAALDREVLDQAADLDEGRRRAGARPGPRLAAAARRGHAAASARGSSARAGHGPAPRARPAAPSARPRRGRASSGRRGSATGSSAGCASVRQRRRRCSTRARQRGAKRQPAGRSIRLGTLPGITASSSRTLARRPGSTRSGPACRGAAGRGTATPCRSARRSRPRTSPRPGRTSRRPRPGRG